MATTKTKTRGKATARSPSRKIADKAQFERFVEAAREAGVDEDPEALDRAMDRLTVGTKPRAS
ncbi:MAG TPA: hypothetical protein VNV38_09390 [Stellaceae bacterium]|jgi:hypothetical protein|nr:hypothetical protein [Stellaceae bacterium]